MGSVAVSASHVGGNVNTCASHVGSNVNNNTCRRGLKQPAVCEIFKRYSGYSGRRVRLRVTLSRKTSTGEILEYACGHSTLEETH